MNSSSSNGKITILPLGAGQDVGRSCILVTMGGKTIMFDCGMHMVLDAIIISHFHLDHCGALPYFTETLGYSGPIYMTYPTKSICPILLEDMRKVMVERKGDTNFFTSQDVPTLSCPHSHAQIQVQNCMKKVIPLDLHQVSPRSNQPTRSPPRPFGCQALSQVKLTVLSNPTMPATFSAPPCFTSALDLSLVYTGDYNMTPDRHLGAAWIDKCAPDVLITETTYATTIRDSKRARERDFLKKVHECVAKGGKVLIPVFALGRAQELCILVEGYWQRMGLDVPVYFSAGLTARANEYYKLFINWTNQKIKQSFVDRNMFEFSHIQAFDPAYASEPRAIFKKWCHDEKNMVILPGYCVAGTVGAKVLAREKQIEIDRWTRVTVNMAVENLSFSAHADAKGIIQLVRMCAPKNVVLVHGEKDKMGFLKSRIISELGMPIAR
ncbi:MAG: hypothetical protein SGCHY_004776 [Lobulomycetales sp.]